MKKIFYLFLIVGLLLCGCGKEKTQEDKLVDLGYTQNETTFTKDTVTLTRELNMEYNSTDMLLQEQIGDSYKNTDLYLKTIKLFIDIPDEVITKGLDLLMDAVKENNRSSEIDIYNKENYYIQLYLSETKKLSIAIVTPRVYKRPKDDKYLLVDDIYGKDYYAAFRRSSNDDKNLEYDKLVIDKIFNNTKVDTEEVRQLVNKKDLCNPEYICQRYLAYTDTNISVLAKNKVYSITYDMNYNNSGTYLYTEHSIEDYENGVAKDLELIQKRAKNDLNGYKEQIVKAYTDKDYTLTLDEMHDGKHFKKEVKLTEDFTVELDIYEDTVEMAYSYHGE